MQWRWCTEGTGGETPNWRNQRRGAFDRAQQDSNNRSIVGNSTRFGQGDAKSDAMDPDLAVVVGSWPRLPAPIRQAILTLGHAMDPPSKPV
jgi:hypothetical protein